MFTGIVEEIGVVREVQRRDGSICLEIAAERVLEGTRKGDSIAVDGVCQTVTELSRGAFRIDALAETLRKTTLGGLRVGEKVHLERALSLLSRLGGHFVQGHVSGVARVRKLHRSGENLYLVLSLPPELDRYCVAEGSIAIDGVSLTICALRPGEIEVDLIPQTRKLTVLEELRVGDEVNVENDVIAKYVERLLRGEEAAHVGLQSLLNSVF